jgi:FkbM family methyltransferase
VLVKPIDLSKHWNIFPSGVLHVGAHVAEEKALYVEANWGPVIWVEAQPELAADLNLKFSGTTDQVICATIWDKNDVDLTLKISSNSGSTSLLDFGTHQDSYPQISFISEINVVTSRLDKILDSRSLPNFLNLDIQGVELQALRSLGDLITQLNFVYVEINTKEVYQGCTKLVELDEFLKVNGFRRIITRRYFRHGWGEAMYVRNQIDTKRLKSIFARTSNAIQFYIPQIKNLLRHLMRGTLNG